MFNSPKWLIGAVPVGLLLSCQPSALPVSTVSTAPSKTSPTPSTSVTPLPLSSSSASPSAAPTISASVKPQIKASLAPIPQISSLTLTVSSRFLNAAGQSRQLKITALDSEGQPVDVSNQPFVYRSSRPQDFQVNPQGLVTALVDIGYSEIQVTLPGLSTDATILFSVAASDVGSTFSQPVVSTPIPQPSLNALAPATYAIGDSVRFSGSRLNTVEQVTIDGVVAPILSQQADSIQIQIPAGAISGALIMQSSEQNLQTSLNLSNRIWFVNDTATGKNTGGSWTDAFRELQSALSQAQPTDEIWLAKGSYRPSSTGDRNAHFMLPAQARLYGGFTGSETVLSQRDTSVNESILSGDLNGDDVYGTLPFNNGSDNSINILRHGEAALIDGIVIEGGNANRADDLPSPRGAGIYTGNQSLTLRNTIFRNLYSSDRGGAWYKEGGNQELSKVSFLRVAAGGSGGGGVYNQAGNLSFDNVTFDNSQANGAGGGGVYNNSNTSVLTFKDTTFKNSQANGGGGAGIYSVGGTLNLTRVSFTGGEATGAGGSAIYAGANAIELTEVNASNNNHSLGVINISNSNLNASKLTLKDNTATSPGGGIYAANTHLNISQSSFDNNDTNSVGGAIYASGNNTFSLTDTEFKNNDARNPGGGLYLSGLTQANITDCVFEQNTTQNIGGAAYIQADTLSLKNSRILNNTSQGHSGGMYLSATTFTALDKLIVVGNQSTSFGAGLYLTGTGTPIIRSAVFANNTSAGTGGGIFSSAGNLQMQHVSFSENTATSGDAVFMSSGTLNLRNSIIWDNEATPIDLNGNQLTAFYSVIRDLNNYTLQAGSIGNIFTDPVFLNIVDPDGADNLYFTADDGLSLSNGSTAQNLDVSGAGPLANDITGRTLNGNPDAGAYEIHS